MDTGGCDPDYIRTSMMKAIASYIIAFVKREGMTPEQATTLLGITKAQLLELVQANIASFNLEEMISVLSSIGQYVSVCSQLPLESDPLRFTRADTCEREHD